MNNKSFSRRSFLGRSACASMGAVGLANSLTQFGLINSALAAGSAPTDYRALVCIFFMGGMDSNNILIPGVEHPYRPDYVSGRGVVGIPANELVPIQPLDGSSFGLPPGFESMADLFNNGEVAFVANVGSLAYPISGRNAYMNKTVPLPMQLFSHSDQQTQWQSSIADQPFKSGWGGRIADLINDVSNPAGLISMNIALDSLNSFQVGEVGKVVQYAVTRNGSISLSGFGSNYGSAMDTNGVYRANSTGRRLEAFESMMRYSQNNLLEQEYNNVLLRARENEERISAALDEADATGTDFDALFENAGSRLADQLKMVARLIAGRSALGNQRQIFFCQMGGFDTHQTQNGSLPPLIEDIGDALSAFNATMKSIGAHDSVLTCTQSDFARTFTPNKEDGGTAGTDHAWGGHQLVMGGPVAGQRIYGHFPELTLGGGIDASRGRGRWIPSTSVDQYAAVMANWMGVGSDELNLIFPNLHRFDNPLSVASANLGFLQAG